MEIIPRLNKKERYPFDLEVSPYLRDHHLEGKVILPAVEALMVLAGAVKINYPQIDVRCGRRASFSRFLTIAPDAVRLPVLVDLEISGDGSVTASLLTSVKSKTGAISRTVEHARMEFAAADSAGPMPPPFLDINKPERNCISVPSAIIYRELVPFGAAYQNITGDLSVSPRGARAFIRGGDYGADEGLLGSPFPLDAAMHAACVWGQRFAGEVCFPVGFEKRVIYQKTEKGKEYIGHVAPVSVSKEMLIFDAWIYKDDVICESISGIQMKDVTRGRLRPPEWIMVNSG